MAKEAVAVTQLATRIPRDLRRAIKVQCVTTDTSLMAFVCEAIAEKLARESRPRTRRRG